MPEKLLVVRKRDDLWEVKAPGAHRPDSTHSTRIAAQEAATDYLVKNHGGGYVDVIF